MSKNIKVTLVLMLILVGFISCEKDDGLKDTQDQSLFNLKTVNPKDAESAFLSKYNNKSTQYWITPYFQYNDSIGLNNSDAQITVTPVTTGFSNSYSRMFSIEINGNIESVLYHMIPNDISSQNSFWGQAILTDLSGNVRAAFDVEDNLYTSYYDFINHTETVNVLQNSNKSQNKAGNDDDSCLIEGDEESMVICDDEVVVTAPPNEGLSTGIIVIFVPEFFPNDGQDGGTSPIPDSSPTEPTAPAGNTNQDGCTEPGKIKDDNGNCVDPPDECPEDNMIQNDDGDCECKSGYVEDKDGSCVKKPCENDPVENPEVAEQTVSGVDGGRYGCTRNGFPLCPGSTTKRKHGGLDVLNPYGAPVFAMYDGTATAISTWYKNAGWISYQTVNGETIKIQYFHLQKENRASGTIKAGDIIGYQGDSGSLKAGIADGDCASHVHIKIKDSSNNTLDPEDYIGNLTSSSDDGPSIINNDCN
jgi:hypothetical protein